MKWSASGPPEAEAYVRLLLTTGVYYDRAGDDRSFAGFPTQGHSLPSFIHWNAVPSSRRNRHHMPPRSGRCSAETGPTPILCSTMYSGHSSQWWHPGVYSLWMMCRNKPLWWGPALPGRHHAVSPSRMGPTAAMTALPALVCSSRRSQTTMISHRCSFLSAATGCGTGVTARHCASTC